MVEIFTEYKFTNTFHEIRNVLEFSFESHFKEHCVLMNFLKIFLKLCISG